MLFKVEEKKKENTFCEQKKCNQFPNIIDMQYFGKASTNSKRKNRGVLQLLCSFPSLQDYSRINHNKFSTSFAAFLVLKFMPYNSGH